MSQSGATLQDTLSFQAEELTALVEKDLDALAMLATPNNYAFPFPDYYLQLWEMLLAAVRAGRDFSKFAIGLPRGHAKSSVIKLLILYCILFTNKKFILVVGANEENAKSILSDVIDMLDSENIRQLFGNWRFGGGIDRAEKKVFEFRGRPIVLKAVGVGTSIRGINEKNNRPDLIVLDDAQTKECAASVAEAQKYISWFLGTLSKAKSPFGCTYIYIGNMYPDLEIKKGLYTCLLRNLQKNGSWVSFIVGAILADGKALWEDLQPLAQLLGDLQQDLDMGCPEIFFSELLNDPASASSSLLDTSKLIPFTKTVGDFHVGSMVIIDPSAGKKKSDDLVIGYVEIYDGRPILIEMKRGKFSPMEMIDQALGLCYKYGCGAIAVESVAYQSTALFWFAHVCEQRGITGIDLIEMLPHGVSKQARIINNFFKPWMKDEIGVHENHHSEVLAQAVRFNPMKTDNQDDILDVMAYAMQMLMERPDAWTLSGEAVQVAGTDFAALPSVDSFANNSVIYR